MAAVDVVGCYKRGNAPPIPLSNTFSYMILFAPKEYSINPGKTLNHKP